MKAIKQLFKVTVASILIITLAIGVFAEVTIPTTGWQTGNELTADSNGTWRVFVRDNAGNVSYQDVVVDHVDTTGPAITNVVGTATNWVQQDTVTVTANDQASTGGAGAVGLHEKAYAITDTADAPASEDAWQTSNVLSITSNGTKYVWARDALGNKTSATFNEVWIDREKPVIGSIAYVDGAATDWTKSKNFGFSGVTDNHGLTGLSYAFTDSNVLDASAVWSTTVTEKEYTVEGTHYGWVKDIAGNISDPYEFAVQRIDNDNPEITNTDYATAWAASQNIVTVTATDAASGVKHYALVALGSIIEESDWQESNMFTVFDNNTYSIYARDTAGNISNEQQIEIANIDKIKPVMTPATVNTTWATSNIVVINATDAESGMQDYALVDAESAPVEADWKSSNTFEVFENKNYKAYARDSVGNFESQEVTVSYIDRTAPVFSTVTGVLTKWGKQDTITAVAADTQSGEVKYAITEDAVAPDTSNAGLWNATGKFTVSENKTYKIWAKDAVNNISTYHEFTESWTDNTAPSISVINGLSNWGTSNTASIVASDNSLGVIKYGFTDRGILEDAVVFGDSNSKVYTENCEQIAWAKDEAGNVTSLEFEITKVDTTAPSVTTVNQTSGWETSKLAQIAGEDTQSGISKYAVSNTNSTAGLVWQDSNEFTFTTNNTKYAFIKDAVGNISDGYEFSVSEVDTDIPVINSADIQSTWAQTNTIKINATDSQSGVVSWKLDAVTAGIDSFDWQSSDSFTVSANGDYKAYVKDAVGRISVAYELTASYVDTNKPTVTNAVNDTDTWKRSHAIGITASDIAGEHCGASEVAKYGMSSEAETEPTTWQDTANIEVVANGTVYLWVMDGAGNISETGYLFTENLIDRTGPAISDTVCEGDYYASYGHSVTIKITAEDVTGIGVVDKYCATTDTAVPNADYSDWQESPNIVKTENGQYYVWAMDSLGNIGDSRLVTITGIDNTAPVIETLCAALEGSDSEGRSIYSYNYQELTNLGYTAAEAIRLSPNPEDIGETSLTKEEFRAEDDKIFMVTRTNDSSYIEKAKEYSDDTDFSTAITEEEAKDIVFCTIKDPLRVIKTMHLKFENREYITENGTYYAWLVDYAGNISEPYEFTIDCFDDDPPEVEILGYEIDSDEGTITVSFNATDAKSGMYGVRGVATASREHTDTGDNNMADPYIYTYKPISNGVNSISIECNCSTGIDGLSTTFGESISLDFVDKADYNLLREAFKAPYSATNRASSNHTAVNIMPNFKNTKTCGILPIRVESIVDTPEYRDVNYTAIGAELNSDRLHELRKNILESLASNSEEFKVNSEFINDWLNNSSFYEYLKNSSSSYLNLEKLEEECLNLIDTMEEEGHSYEEIDKAVGELEASLIREYIASSTSISIIENGSIVQQIKTYGHTHISDATSANAAEVYVASITDCSLSSIGLFIDGYFNSYYRKGMKAALSNFGDHAIELFDNWECPKVVLTEGDKFKEYANNAYNLYSEALDCDELAVANAIATVLSTPMDFESIIAELGDSSNIYKRNTNLDSALTIGNLSIKGYTLRVPKNMEYSVDLYSESVMEPIGDKNGDTIRELYDFSKARAVDNEGYCRSKYLGNGLAETLGTKLSDIMNSSVLSASEKNSDIANLYYLISTTFVRLSDSDITNRGGDSEGLILTQQKFKIAATDIDDVAPVIVSATSTLTDADTLSVEVSFTDDRILDMVNLYEGKSLEGSEDVWGYSYAISANNSTEGLTFTRKLLDHNTLESNTDSITFTDERIISNGTYYFFVKDMGGNISNGYEITVDCFDDVAPVIESLDMPTSWVQTASVTINANDPDSGELSGVAGYAVTEFGADKPEADDWQISNAVELTTNGHFLAWVKDASGNIVSQEFSFNYLDSVAPELRAYDFDVTGTKVTIKARDLQSGVKSIYVNDTEYEYIGTQRIVDIAAGTRYIEIYAKDNALRVSDTVRLRVPGWFDILDTLNVTGISYNGDYSEATVSVSTTGAAIAGVYINDVYYPIEHGTTVGFSSDGVKHVRAQAVDVNGDRSAVYSVRVPGWTEQVSSLSVSSIDFNEDNTIATVTGTETGESPVGIASITVNGSVLNGNPVQYNILETDNFITAVVKNTLGDYSAERKVRIPGRVLTVGTVKVTNAVFDYTNHKVTVTATASGADTVTGIYVNGTLMPGNPVEYTYLETDTEIRAKAVNQDNDVSEEVVYSITPPVTGSPSRSHRSNRDSDDSDDSANTSSSEASSTPEPVVQSSIVEPVVPVQSSSTAPVIDDGLLQSEASTQSDESESYSASTEPVAAPITTIPKDTSSSSESSEAPVETIIIDDSYQKEEEKKKAADVAATVVEVTGSAVLLIAGAVAYGMKKANKM